MINRVVRVSVRGIRKRAQNFCVDHGFFLRQLSEISYKCARDVSHNLQLNLIFHTKDTLYQNRHQEYLKIRLRSNNMLVYGKLASSHRFLSNQT